MRTTCRFYAPTDVTFYKAATMNDEFHGIEKRLGELSERLQRLGALKDRPIADFDADPYLRDIVERNLEVAIQCCLDISHRLIALERARKPADYYEAVLILGELEVLPADFARHLAPIAGFRNILVHEYLSIDWEHVYRHLQSLDDLIQFEEYVRSWMKS